jgi:hypothetical protein
MNQMKSFFWDSMGPLRAKNVTCCFPPSSVDQRLAQADIDLAAVRLRDPQLIQALERGL